MRGKLRTLALALALACLATSGALALQGRIGLRIVGTPAPSDVLTTSDLTYQGIAALTDDATTDDAMAFSESAMTGRVVSGVTHLFIAGGSISGSKVAEYIYVGAYPDLTTAQANRMALSCYWGDIYHGHMTLQTGDTNQKVVRGLYWSGTKLIWAYGSGYAAGGYHQNSLGASTLSACGTSSGFGAWRTDASSQLTRGYLMATPDGNIAVGAPITSGNSSSPWGLDLYEFSEPSTSLPANDPDDPSDVGITTTELVNHPISAPQTRGGDTNFVFSFWNCNRSVDSQLTSGNVASSTGTTMTGSAVSWTLNQWAGKLVRIDGGTGLGETRTVVSNTSSILTISSAWASNPDAFSTFVIYTGDAGSPPTACDGIYDSAQGGYTLPGTDLFTSIDMMGGVTWIYGSTKTGVLSFGQLTETLSGETYPCLSVTAWWYGPNVNYCGQDGSSYSQSTGDTTQTMQSTLWINDPAHLATDPAPQNLNAIASQIPNKAGGLYQFGSAWYEPTSKLLFVTQVGVDKIGCCIFQPILHVFSVNTSIPAPAPSAAMNPLHLLTDGLPWRWRIEHAPAQRRLPALPWVAFGLAGVVLLANSKESRA